MLEYGIKNTANPDRELTIEFNNSKWTRYPIKTPFVGIGDNYKELIKQYVLPYYKQGGFIVSSEKVAAICQERVVHQSEVKVSWVARLISKFVKKYPNDVGWENPVKIQVAIQQAGFFRILAAVILGGVMKFLFRQPGWYYKIAGNGIAEIDGFNPIAVPPFNEYAILGPENPNQLAQEIEDELGIPFAIVDASNVATQILGKSSKLEQEFKFKDLDIKQIIAGNPMGQGKEQTPFLLCIKE